MYIQVRGSRSDGSRLPDGRSVIDGFMGHGSISSIFWENYKLLNETKNYAKRVVL